MLDEDYESARREAHTLKGIAGTLGMPVIQQAAQELDKVIDSLDILD